MVRFTMGWVCLAVVAIAGPATAQERVGEIAGSFTGAATDVELTTGNQTYEPSGVMFEASYFFNDKIGLTGELGYATGSNVILDLSTTTVAGGARFRFPNDSFVTPSLRATAGLARLNLSGLSISLDTVNRLAVTFGGAVDFMVTENLGIRVQPDFLVVEDFDPFMFRIGFGLSYNFGGPAQ